MKLKISKYIIAAAVLFSATATSTEANAQWNNIAQSTDTSFKNPLVTPNNSSGRAPFAESNSPFHPSPPLRAQPPGIDGDGQKLPVSGGLWILTGLSIIYGIACRILKKER